MNVLGFDTCLESCSVAVGVGLGGAAPRISSRIEPMATGQAERLMPMIEWAVDAAGIGFADIDRIAVTNGPGTFTGMRIGVAAARALALSLGIPVITFTSLEVMALDPRLEVEDGEAAVITIDARRGQVYCLEVVPSPRGDRAGPRLLALSDAAAAGGTNPVVFAGSGAELVAGEAVRQGRPASAVLADLQPDIARVLSAAARAISSPGPPRPLYLRPPDARPQDGKTLARGLR